MAIFTCITDYSECTHLSQHVAANAIEALRHHVSAMPYSDGEDGPHGAELEWLQAISGGLVNIELVPASGCRSTWLWLDGARHEPKYITYIFKTDAEP